MKRPKLADGLALAAAPVFALMALATAMEGDNQLAVLCSQSSHISMLTGMAPMYMLMATFHLPLWFRLTATQ